MVSDELLRILSFVDSTRELTEKRANFAMVDPRWNLISFAIRRHYEGKLITTTSMALAAGVSYGTAMRRITELVDEGLLMKRARTKTGKSFSLHPSKKLIHDFESFALQFKSYVGNSFGFSSDEIGISDFYFGASYMTSRILSYPSAMKKGIGYEKIIRILTPSDPTFKTLADFSTQLNEFCGGRLEVINLPLDELYDELSLNASHRVSNYDVIAIDLPWIGEFVERKLIRSLNKIIDKERFRFSDFHSTAWKGSAYNGDQYALPIQPTTELLFYRNDLFEDAGLRKPLTTDDVILAAKTLHQSQTNIHGIVMNYGEGTPIAHTFMQTMADFGQPLINLPKIRNNFDTNNLKGDHFRPQIDSDGGYQAAEYMIELLKYAHPESINCTWDKRIKLFAQGKAAMTYGWSIRSSVFELDQDSPVHGNVEYVPHPHGPNSVAVSPVGGFSLAIPSNLPEDRVATSWKMMEYLVRPELMKWYVQNGNLSSPRYSTSADPEVQAMSKIIERVDVMEKKGDLQLWPRPPIPEFNDIVRILGSQIHTLLRGECSIKEALKSSQAKVDKLMRESGRYG